MASKLNTKFVLIIVAAAVLGGGAILGGMMLLQWRGDATRNVRQGDAAVAEGNFKRARDLYGRAVHKQPANLEYLQKLEDVVLQIKPDTMEEAVQLYRDRIGILQHRAKHHRTDPEAHLGLLREVYTAARLTGSQLWWDYTVTAADDMWDNVDESDPKRDLAKIYKNAAVLYQPSLKELDELSAVTDELKGLAAKYPDDDLAWSTYVTGHRVVADKMRVMGKTEAMILARWADLDQAAEEALKAVPKGVDVARVNLWRLGARRSGDPSAVPAARVKVAGDHLVSLLGPDTPSMQFGESTELLAAIRELNQYDYLVNSIDLSKAYLAKNPQAIDKQYNMANWMYLSGQMDDAADQAVQIMGSAIIPTSLMSQLQFEIRKRAASLLVDVEQRRWATETDPAKKPERLAAVEAARDKLVALVTNPSNDLLVLRADGRIAQSKGDYVHAVACFERVIKESSVPDIEMLLFSADGLVRINEIGLAHERLAMAVQYQPRNWGLQVEKARMEVRMGRMEQARDTLALLPPEELNKEDVKALALAAARTLTEAPDISNDPITAAIAAAMTAMNRGEFETARTILLGALEQDPKNVNILQTLVGVEFRDGKVDKANEYLAKAIAIQPTNTLFKQWEAALKFSDPIEAITKYNETSVADEGVRAVVMAVTLGSLASQQENAGKLLQDKDPAGADKARALAARARDSQKTWLETAKAKVPNNPDLIEFEFRRAATDKNWAAAEAVVARAKSLNLDQADGNLYKARLELARGNLQEAINTLEGVTDRLSYSSFAWKTLAAAYQSIGNWGQAQRAYEQAYKCNPNDIGAAWEYIGILVYKGDVTRALGVLQTMRKLLPRDSRVRDGWLQLEATAGDAELAFNERKRWYLADPDRVDNAKAYARLLCESTPNWETITDDNLKQIVPEQRWQRLTAEERQKYIDTTRIEWQKKSTDILDRLSANAKDDIQLAVLKARLYRIRNEVMAGESVLREFIESHKPNLTAQMLIELGKYQVDSNHFAEGIANFNEAMKYQDPKAREAHQALGQMYLTLNMFDKALPELLKVEETNPTPMLAQNIIECQVRLRNFEDARKRLDEFVAKQSSTAVTSMLEATILEGQGAELYAKGDTSAAEQKFAEQRELLAKAEAQDVTNPIPRILLAQTYYNQYGRTQQVSLLDDALLALARADKIAPGDMQTRMMRVDVLRAKGDAAGAIAELQRVLEKTPDAPVARRQILQLYLDTGDTKSAFETVNEAITINPTLAFWWETQGDLYSAINRDAASALRSYTKAYDLVANPKMLGKLLDCALAVQPPDYQGILDRLTKDKSLMDSTTSLRLVYARALNGLGKKDEGLEQMALAYKQLKKDIADSNGKIDPSMINDWYSCIRAFYDPTKQTAEIEQFVMKINPSPDLHEKRILARMWATSGPGGLNHALELQNQAIAECTDKPLKSMLLLDLGNYHLTVKQYEQAAAAYEESIKFDPDNVEALNNLAYVAAEELNDPKRALEPAERAAKLRPRDPAILDTQGWVNFLVGNNDKAKACLRQSMLIDESSSPTYLHMAHVLVKSGDTQDAQENLKKALELKPDPKTKSQIEALQAQIANTK